MKRQIIRSKTFARIPSQLKSALRLKLFLLLAKAIAVTDDSDSDNWRIFRSPDGIYAIAPNGKCYRIKLKLIQLLAKVITLTDDSESADWRVFKGPDGIYTIHPSGKYYKININSNGELKLYRGKHRIHLGRRLKQGYFEASKLPIYSSQQWN
ncbi:MAG: hypothetical protein JO235_12170 [Chroococcidiopsidaceae cyanobacterium CP_BM_RX_35]|nr:hypothetical protein [Chroococcidiopsidaceae cyanobacterium CP_BM_RX_35]